MATVEYFKAARRTNRFNANQKVWIRLNSQNHLWIRFKWRGRGRWVNGIVGKNNPSVGEIRQIEVDDDFALRIKHDVQEV